MVVKVKLSKGGPRVSLYESCKKLQWPMPTFEFVKVEPRYYCFTLGLRLACVNESYELQRQGRFQVQEV